MSGLLSEAPELAAQPLSVGATRQDPQSHYYAAINHYAYQGDTALHLAAAAHDGELVEQLLQRGASPGARNRRGAQPLHYASDGVPGSEGWDPAAQEDTVARLLAAGANPDALDKSGVAPLHRAVRTRSTGAVRALLAGGARVGVLNASGSSPLHLAVQDTGRGGSGSESAREAQAEIIRLLIEHGAKASDRNAAGRSVLSCAGAGWIQELLAAAPRKNGS